MSRSSCQGAGAARRARAHRHQAQRPQQDLPQVPHAGDAGTFGIGIERGLVYGSQHVGSVGMARALATVRTLIRCRLAHRFFGASGMAFAAPTDP